MNSILIVEDEDRMRHVFKRWLTHEGYVVWDASNAQVARDQLWSVPVDLILLDLRMPGVNGEELYDLIRSFHRHVKVIIASVYPVEQQTRMIPDADGYYDKADGQKKLMEAIHQVLNKNYCDLKH